MVAERERKTIAYYITPHGFGHAVRSLEVTRYLMEHEAEPRIILVSDLPDFLVQQNVGRPVTVRRRRLDVGLVQLDSLRFDLGATLDSLEQLHRRHDALVEEEVEFFKTHSVQGIVSDIPFLPFYAARQYGIPALGLSNFTWDWIYEAYSSSNRRWGPIVDWIREGYSRCSLFLRLPMHGECSVCPRIRDVPLVARKATRKPEEVRNILGLSMDQKAYLMAFAALDLDKEAQSRIENLEETLFFHKRPLRFQFKNGRSLDPFPQLSYADVIAAVDGVITKPGYGIVSDCLANRAPIIYTDRGAFPEYEILVRNIEEHLSAVYVPSDELYRGNWASAIRRLQSLPRRMPRLRTDGASVCAQYIMEHVNR